MGFFLLRVFFTIGIFFLVRAFFFTMGLFIFTTYGFFFGGGVGCWIRDPLKFKDDGVGRGAGDGHDSSNAFTDTGL